LSLSLSLCLSHTHACARIGNRCDRCWDPLEQRGPLPVRLPDLYAGVC
jgi:hypothetical protein